MGVNSLTTPTVCRAAKGFLNKCRRLRRMVKVLSACGLAFVFAVAGAALAQEDPARRAAVDKVFSIADQQPDPESKGRAVDDYLKSLPRSERATLEADIWWRLRAEKKISREKYIQSMLEHNQEYAPDDFLTLDYWRYLRMIHNKLLRGEMDEAEFFYLQERKFEAVRAQREANEAAARQADAARSAADQERRIQQDPTADVLRAIGGALRPRSRTECYTSFGTTYCSTR